MAGGRAHAAGPAIGPIAITPKVVGAAQLPAAFTTDDKFYAGDVITLDGGPVNASADANGFLTFTAAPSCGQHTLDDKYLVEGSVDQEFAGTFTVSCITATPGSIAGTRQPAPITVAGSTFPLVPQVAIQIDGVQAGQPVGVPNGTLTTVITAQGLSCGPHTVTVTQTLRAASITATAPLVVTQCARIAANPAVMPDGTLTHVTGSGFNPGAPVAVTWQSSGGAVLGTCSANAVGAQPISADASGAVDAYCLAVPHGSLGAEQIAADQGPAGQLSAEHATAPVVVEGGSMQPSTGDQFVFRR